MPQYVVEWSLRLSADSPEEAARIARDEQMHPNGMKYFTVYHEMSRDGACIGSFDFTVPEENKNAI